jgi:hypothetical protein
LSPEAREDRDPAKSEMQFVDELRADISLVKTVHICPEFLAPTFCSLPIRGRGHQLLAALFCTLPAGGRGFFSVRSLSNKAFFRALKPFLDAVCAVQCL